MPYRSACVRRPPTAISSLRIRAERWWQWPASAKAFPLPTASRAGGGMSSPANAPSTGAEYGIGPRQPWPAPTGAKLAGRARPAVRRGDFRLRLQPRSARGAPPAGWAPGGLGDRRIRLRLLLSPPPGRPKRRGAGRGGGDAGNPRDAAEGPPQRRTRRLPERVLGGGPAAHAGVHTSGNRARNRAVRRLGPAGAPGRGSGGAAARAG